MHLKKLTEKEMHVANKTQSRENMFTRISFGKGSGCDNMDYRYSHKRQKCSHMQERSPYRRCSRKKGENTEVRGGRGEGQKVEARVRRDNKGKEKGR